jgi:hypothetical protein
MAAKPQKLSELAKTIRSKNAGVDLITFDIIFSDRATYERVKRARVLTRESVQRLYGLAPERISDFVEFDPGNAIKFTIYRAAQRRSGRSRYLRRAAMRALLDIEVPAE